MILKTMRNRLRALVGDAIETELEREIVGSCRSVLDVGSGVDSPLRFFSSDLERTVGVDAHAPAVEASLRAGIHSEGRVLDVTRIAEAFAPKSFDCVLACDLIEHLEKAEGEALLAAMETLARRKVIVYTPNGFVPQNAYDGNQWQRHRSGWTALEMRRRGFAVRGMGGWKPLRGERAGVRWKPLLLWETIALSSQIFTRRNPRHAFQILCVKHLHDDLTSNANPRAAKADAIETGKAAG